jgi:hypothetical protein
VVERPRFLSLASLHLYRGGAIVQKRPPLRAKPILLVVGAPL